MKWILLMLLFQGGELADYTLLVGDSQEKCEAAKARFTEAAKARGVELWAECREVTLPTKAPEKPKGEPGTEQKS